MPTDAAVQRRLLLMLGKYWIESPDKRGLAARLSGIVATQEFVTRYGLFSGRLAPPSAPSGARVLSIPASLVEMSSWLFAGLRCWTAGELGVARDEADDGGWTIVSTPTPPRSIRPFAHVSALELIARTLAEEGRDLALHGSNAALLIREQVPELAGRGGDIDPTALPRFDQNAAYMAVEFTIAHELGHALAATNLPSGADDYPAAEEEADRAGCLLLAMTASRRTFGWADGRLGPWTQAALGLALFVIVIEGRMRLADGLARDRGEVRSIERTERECVRAKVARRGLAELLARAKGCEGEDPARVSALSANADAYLRDLGETAAAVPDAAFEHALSIARESP